MAEHNKIGEMGEDIASNWLANRGFSIVVRNYRKKFGEIDIVARETTGLLHFVEVKAVSYETRHKLEYAVSHETWRPEENVHAFKQDRLKRAIQTWLAENKYQSVWQIDVMTVRIVPREKYAAVKMLENLVFE
jgi:putative endonuclease